MNRIILIGNGFDLAHGLETRYSDFISYFWEQQRLLANDFSKWEGDKYGSLVYKNEFFKLKYREDESFKGYTDIAVFKQDISDYENDFLKKIEKVRVITKWVDLEELYYRELLNCLKIEKLNNDASVVSPIEELNKDFEDIKGKFNDYLYQKIINKRIEKISEIEEHIWENNKSDFQGKVLFLNFNYTKTEDLYTIKDENGKIDKTKNEVIHIHGEVNNEDNPIIFGYGDELAVDFKDIENINRNEFLENAKSIKYLETDNYDRLLEFMNTKEEKYDVFILGHSCGNSDRTLLQFSCSKIVTKSKFFILKQVKVGIILVK